jgi:hypothetical protein
MPSSSSFLRVSGAQPFSYFLNGGAAKKSKKSKKTRSVVRKKTRMKTKKRVKSRMKTNKKRISKRKSLRKSNRSRTLTLPSMSSEKTLLCKCDKKRKIKGTEPSPKGLGYCAHCTPVNVTMRGKDGKLWENVKYSKGKRWKKVNQSGGFIRGGTF